MLEAVSEGLRDDAVRRGARKVADDLLRDAPALSRLRTEASVALGDVVDLNVGGTIFTALRQPLAEHSEYFAALFRQHPDDVAADEDGAILIDRCPESFQNVLSVLQGRVRRLSANEWEKLESDVGFYGIALDVFERATKTHPQRLAVGGPVNQCPAARFIAGPGTHADGMRFRSYYISQTLGPAITMGSVEVTLRVDAAEYVGIGVVPADAPWSRDAEFHKVADAVVFYMSGACYSNCPKPLRWSFPQVAFRSGDTVKLVLDMASRTVDLHVGGKWERVVLDPHGSSRMQCAVTIKEASSVTVVHSRWRVVEETYDEDHTPSP